MKSNALNRNGCLRQNAKTGGKWNRIGGKLLNFAYGFFTCTLECALECTLECKLFFIEVVRSGKRQWQKDGVADILTCSLKGMITGQRNSKHSNVR